jgi:uncharacterized coiled-coil protein SlyX
MRIDVFHHYPEPGQSTPSSDDQLKVLNDQLQVMIDQLKVMSRQLRILTILATRNLASLEETMSDLTTKIDEALATQDELDTELDAAIGRVQTDVKKMTDQMNVMTQKIVDLESAVAAGTATPEDLAKLDQLIEKNNEMIAKVKAINPSLPDVMPPPDPSDPHVDNTLPPVPAPIDPGLHPDHTLPGDLPHPDQSLPGPQPIVNPLKKKP